MNRTITLAFLGMLAFTGVQAQTITLKSIDQTLANDYAGGCEIDLDNDGLKEIIVSGYPNWEAAPGRVIVDAEGNEKDSGLQSWVLKWDGSAYKATEFSELCGRRSTIIPADFNGDGNIDLYIAGEAYDYTGVYLNDGKGNFTKDPAYKVIDRDGNETDNWYPRSADVADFNLDGRPDLVTIGWSTVGGNYSVNVGVLINQGDGSFKNVLPEGTVGDGVHDYGFALCTVKAYDLNMDGYPDFLVQGNVDNIGGDGYSVDSPLTKDGKAVGRAMMSIVSMGLGDDGNPAFYDAGLSTGVAHQYGNGNFAVADFNNDGTPDIFVTGETPDDGVAGWEFYPLLLNGKIDAEGTPVYTDNTSFVARGKDVRPLNSNNIGVRAIDYNGDGYYDLFYDGWSTQMLDGSANTQGGFLLTGSAAGMVNYQRIPGASEMGIFFLDYGVQGALNYTFTGYHGDATYFDEANIGRSMVFTMNPWQVAARPDAPTDLNAEVDGRDVTLSWTPAASSMKNVTYEYYLKNEKGTLINNVHAFVGGDKDGLRKVLLDGNAYMNTTLNLKNVPDGTYEWGVQTVNAAQRGSVFAKGGTIKVGTGVTAINSVAKTANAKTTAIYSVDGKQLSRMQQGLNIVKMSDGTVKKVIK